MLLNTSNFSRELEGRCCIDQRSRFLEAICLGSEREQGDWQASATGIGTILMVNQSWAFKNSFIAVRQCVLQGQQKAEHRYLFSTRTYKLWVRREGAARVRQLE